MKSLLLAVVLLSLSTQAFSKTITVTGLRAKALMIIGDATDSTEGSMGGRSDMELRNVRCEKTVDDQNEIYLQKCSFSAFTDVVVSSDAETNRYTAEEMRTALREILGNEVLVSSVKKAIAVELIKCHGAGAGHTLDALNIEQSFKCTLVTK